MKTRIKIIESLNGEKIYIPQVNKYSLMRRLFYRFIAFIFLNRKAIDSFWSGLEIIEEDNFNTFFGRNGRVGEYDTAFGNELRFNELYGAKSTLDKYIEQEKEKIRVEKYLAEKEKEIKSKRAKEKKVKVSYINY
jgi:hypothetical protein